QVAANTAILKRLAEIDKTLVQHDAALSDLYRKLLPLLQPPADPAKRPHQTPLIAYTYRRASHLGRNFDVRDVAHRRWNCQPVRTHTFEMEGDGFLDFASGFFDGITGCNATRQIGNVCAVVAFRLLDNDRVSH